MSRELVELAMHGDREAFGALASRVLGRMVGTAGLILGSRDAADDAAQDALVRAWRDLPTLRDPDRFEAWLHRILIRACHDHRRSGMRAVRLGPDAGRNDSVADVADAVVHRSVVAASLARLTPDHRAVLVLRYYLDLSLDEIAHSLSVPVGTVKSRLHRALDAMEADMAAEAREAAEITA